MSNSDTKRRILDAAEQLFARRGFHNTSLRAITVEAGVNLAAVNYHFGSKDALLEAVFERRLTPLNCIRQERLESVREAAKRGGRPPAVRDIFRAVIEPTLRFRESEPGASDFITLVGRTIFEPDEMALRIFQDKIRPLFTLCFDILCEALPEVPRDVVFWRLQFAMGAMGHLMCGMGKIKMHPEGISIDKDMDSIVEMLILFVTAGMEAR